VNKELWMVIIPPVSWLLFALGGTQISDTTKGQKWIRRFALPAFWGLCVASTGAYLQAALVCGLGIGILCLGYGDGKSWLYRAGVGCLYGCISLPLGVSWWNLATAVVFIVYFLLSNWKYTASEFTWKICEGTYGLMIGITIAYLLMGA
jgi:hypothetical protein